MVWWMWAIDRLDRVEGLAQADDALVGVHVHPQDVGELLQVDGLDRGYFHSDCPPADYDQVVDTASTRPPNSELLPLLAGTTILVAADTNLQTTEGCGED